MGMISPTVKATPSAQRKNRTMKKSDIKPMPEYFDRYINLVDDIELDQAFQKSLNEIELLDINLIKRVGLKTYAPNKWTINEICQHLIDAERMFCNRILMFARQDQAVPPGFDENMYAANSKANNRNIVDIIDELKTVRLSTISFFKSFDDEDFFKTGLSWKYETSVLAMGFTILGHQIHHFNFIKTHYYKLADK